MLKYVFFGGKVSDVDYYVLPFVSLACSFGFIALIVYGFCIAWNVGHTMSSTDDETSGRF